MKKFVAFAIFLLSLTSYAAVVITPNLPGTTYPFGVMAGSERKINVRITGGTLNTVTWSITNQIGSPSVTLVSPGDNGLLNLPLVGVRVGNTPGNCTVTGSSGPHPISSTVSFTIHAVSNDDVTKTADFPFLVCANLDEPHIKQQYTQVYKSSKWNFYSMVFGNVDQTGTWSILSGPVGGNATLTDTTFRDTEFNSGTVSGEYTLQFTSHANPSKSDTAIVYVAAIAKPSYVSTPQGAVPSPCEVDTAAFTGRVYDVGPSQTTTTIRSINTQDPVQWPATGNIIRIHNEDTTGTNPTTYAEYTQIQGTGQNTHSHPNLICGVPDALGNPPIWTGGSNAQGASWVSPGSTGGAAAGHGVLSLYVSHNFGYWGWNPLGGGPYFTTISGLDIRGAKKGNTYIDVDGTTVQAYGEGASSINIRSGYATNIYGNVLDNSGLGLFSAENANSGWAGITQMTVTQGNAYHDNGTNGFSTDHHIYMQSWGALVTGDHFSHMTAGASGSDVKMRGVEGTISYIYSEGGGSRNVDFVDNEDSGSYETLEGYLTDGCGVYCDELNHPGTTPFGVNRVIAAQQQFLESTLYGSILHNGAGTCVIHYAQDHFATGLADRAGTLDLFNNTIDSPNGLDVFDTGQSCLSGSMNMIYTPTLYAARNIFFTDPSAKSFFTLGSTNLWAGQFTTNVLTSGSFSIVPPVFGGRYNDGLANGFSNGGTQDGSDWPLASPVDTHMVGLTNPNFLTTVAKPYGPSFRPLTGSAMINAGGSLNARASQYKVRYQYNTVTNALDPNLNPLDIGAVSFGGPPVLASVTVAPTPINLLVGRTSLMAATCRYNDDSVNDCTSSSTWSNGGSSHFTVSSTGLVTGVSLGSGTVTATSGSITSASATINIVSAPPILQGNVTIRGSVIIR